jgi:Uma2 family endonuclease
MAQPADKHPMTPAEYLVWERDQLEKHEYHAGEVFAMARATREHNLVVAAVVTRLTLALAERPCEVYPSDRRVYVPLTGLYTYPDASVACEPPELDVTGGVDTLKNPTVVVEVLSPSTEAYDRGKKFEQYRALPSLRDYVLVASTEVLVEHYARRPDGSWLFREHRAGGRLALSIGAEVGVDELYWKVFPVREGAAPQAG